MNDRYHTIIKATDEILYKDRGSKFYATVFPFTEESQLTEIVDRLRNRHPKAGHHCYAWKIGAGEDHYRSNDDGEPNYSAGEPILSQILAAGLSDVLIVVSRVFGGTKLGVGGLIQAYREAAKLAIEQASIVQRVITDTLTIYFEYPQMSPVMRFIEDQGYTIKEQRLTTTCEIDILVPLTAVSDCLEQLNAMYPIKAKSQGTNH